MSFLTLSRIEVPATLRDALRTANHHLCRIADALERLSPALPADDTPPHVADLNDLRRTDPLSLAHVERELDRYARDHAVALNSESFLQSIYDYEQQVLTAYGPEAINELPWNKAAGGPLFQNYPDYQRQRQAKQAPPESPEQSTPRPPSEVPTGR